MNFNIEKMMNIKSSYNPIIKIDNEPICTIKDSIYWISEQKDKKLIGNLTFKVLKDGYSIGLINSFYINYLRGYTYNLHLNSDIKEISMDNVTFKNDPRLITNEPSYIEVTLHGRITELFFKMKMKLEYDE